MKLGAVAVFANHLIPTTYMLFTKMIIAPLHLIVTHLPVHLLWIVNEYEHLYSVCKVFKTGHCD